MLKYIEHPSTVITEILLARGHDTNYKQIQRIRKKLRETIVVAELKPIPTFADMVEMGRQKVRPKKPKLDYDEDIPDDAISEAIWLVRDGVKLEETQKN